MKPLTDLYHVTMALYYTGRLALNRKAVTNTYCYNYHLEQTSYFHRVADRWAEANPGIAASLAEPTLFLDHQPDRAALNEAPEGSLGRAYASVMDQYDSGSLDVLRRLRLETLPHEATGLDMAARPPPTQTVERRRWMTSRRNLYMTTSHDFAHLLAGCDVSPEGEAIVAMYQYHHLRIPQNFLNMWNARLFLSATFRRSQILRIRKCTARVAASPHPVTIPWESFWHRPLSEARVSAGLPPQGLQTCPMNDI